LIEDKILEQKKHLPEKKRVEDFLGIIFFSRLILKQQQMPRHSSKKHSKKCSKYQHGGFTFFKLSDQEKAKLAATKQKVSQGLSNFKQSVSDKLANSKRKFSDWKKERIYKQAVEASFKAQKASEFDQRLSDIKSGKYSPSGSQAGGEKHTKKVSKRHSSKKVAKKVSKRRSSKKVAKKVSKRRSSKKVAKKVIKKSRH